MLSSFLGSRMFAILLTASKGRHRRPLGNPGSKQPRWDGFDWVRMAPMPPFSPEKVSMKTDMGWEVGWGIFVPSSESPQGSINQEVKKAGTISLTVLQEWLISAQGGP